MALELYIDQHPYEINTFVYSGGEVSVKIEDTPTPHYNFGEAFIKATLQSSNDVMALLMLTNAVRQLNPGIIITLSMDYVPYARQDRVCNSGEALAIKVFCDLINSQKYEWVEITDPHSDVTPALLNNCVVHSQEYTFRNGMRNAEFWSKGKDNIVLVSPDAGANKKIFELARNLGLNHVVRADKTRDVQTGAITGTVVYSEHVGDKDFLIVDDVIDGGRTFTELAKILRPLTTGKIILYGTHGIFSKGLEVFDGLIDEVYTANPWHPDSWKPYTNLLAK